MTHGEVVFIVTIATTLIGIFSGVIVVLLLGALSLSALMPAAFMGAVLSIPVNHMAARAIP